MGGDKPSEICRFPLPGILSFFDLLFELYLEMNAHDHHKLT